MRSGNCLHSPNETANHHHSNRSGGLLCRVPCSETGIEDKTQPEGYYLSARYIMTEHKGHWTTGGSDL
jgi:hypothetical protein